MEQLADVTFGRSTAGMACLAIKLLKLQQQSRPWLLGRRNMLQILKKKVLIGQVGV